MRTQTRVLVNHKIEKLIDELREKKSDLDFYKEEKIRLIDKKKYKEERIKLMDKIKEREAQLTRTAEKLIKDMGEFSFCFCGYGSKDRKQVIRHIIKKHGVIE